MLLEKECNFSSPALMFTIFLSLLFIIDFKAQNKSIYFSYTTNTTYRIILLLIKMLFLLLWRNY